MTIPDLATGDTITEAWTDAVSGQLNNLPPGIVFGSTGFSDTSSFETISFGVTFASPPIVLASVDISTSGDITWHVDQSSVTTTGFPLRARINGATTTAGGFVQWVAIGTLA